MDISSVDLGLDCRAITFENPTGARGAGGSAAGGRKGAPSRRIRSGERVVLIEIDGPGTVRHLWMTFPPGPPEAMRGLVLEAFYDGAAEPSISVPCLASSACHTDVRLPTARRWLARRKAEASPPTCRGRSVRI